MAPMPDSQTVRDRGDHRKSTQHIEQADRDARPHRGPASRSSPDGSIPETLGKKDCRKDRRGNGDPEKEPAPIHRICAPGVTDHFSTSAEAFSCDVYWGSRVRWLAAGAVRLVIGAVVRRATDRKKRF